MFAQYFPFEIFAGRIENITDTWMSGTKLGALTGFCFCAAAVGVNYLYEKKPCSLFLINAGYAIVGNIIAGIIICCWQ